MFLFFFQRYQWGFAWSYFQTNPCIGGKMRFASAWKPHSRNAGNIWGKIPRFTCADNCFPSAMKIIRSRRVPEQSGTLEDEATRPSELQISSQLRLQISANVLCTHTQTHISLYIYVSIYLSIYPYIYISIYIYIYIYLYISIYIYLYISIYIYIYKYIYIYLYI